MKRSIKYVENAVTRSLMKLIEPCPTIWGSVDFLAILGRYIVALGVPFLSTLAVELPPNGLKQY